MGGIIPWSRGDRGNASKLNYRVGTVDNTGQGSHWVYEEFGVNPNQLGHLTPQIVRQAALDAHAMEQQVAMAKVFVAHSKKIIEGKVQIEKLRADLIEYGLAKKEDVDGIVKHVIELAQKHHGHIEKMLKEVEWSKKTIQAETRSKISQGENAFRNKVELILERHNQTIKDQNASFQSSRQAIATSAAKNRHRQQVEGRQKERFMNYINGGDTPRWSMSGGAAMGRPARVMGGRKTAMGQLWG